MNILKKMFGAKEWVRGTPVSLGNVADVANGMVPEGWTTIHALRRSFSDTRTRVGGFASVYDRSHGTAQVRVSYLGDPNRVRVTFGDLDLAEVSIQMWSKEHREAYQIGKRMLEAARQLQSAGAETIEVRSE